MVRAATAWFLAELAVAARLAGMVAIGAEPEPEPHRPGDGVRAPLRRARTPPVGGRRKTESAKLLQATDIALEKADSEQFRADSLRETAFGQKALI